MEEQEINNRKVRIAAKIDAVGLFCPMPLILLIKELASMKSNQVVEILADDSDFQSDLTAWCKQTDNNILSVSKNEEGIFSAYVEKA
jgi:TusA-related sulfurtransferase